MKLVVTIGGANAERVLQLDPTQLRWGRKHTVMPVTTRPGGSSVNQGCRLLATGIEIFPIWPVAKDERGRMIVSEVEALARAANCSVDLTAIYMEGDDLSTPLTTVFSWSAQRTTLTELDPSTLTSFRRHCALRLRALFDGYGRRPDAVMVGHIHADRKGLGDAFGGDLSRSVIETFFDAGVAVFVNFGESQYRLGAGSWEKFLGKVECFQLGLEEIREFCHDVQVESLEDILAWFRGRCTVVITMGSLGAVAQRKGSRALSFAWPGDLRPGELMDATGAGDAFFAGLVATALEKPLHTDDALNVAMDTARVWAAYVCTAVGGSRRYPSPRDLEAFRLQRRGFVPSESKAIEDASSILKILDLHACDRGRAS